MTAPAPPTPAGLPFLGHTLRWARNPLTIGSWANDRVGGVASIELLDDELILVTDPEVIQEVLVEKRESFPKSEQYETVFGEGLGSVSGDQWRKQRDVTSQFFRPTRIDSYADDIVSLTTARAERWSEGDEIGLFDEMKDLTLEILFETLFDHSIDVEGADANIREAIDDLDEWFRPTSWVLPDWVPTPARSRFSRAKTEIDAIAEELMTDTAASEGLLATLKDQRHGGDATLSESEIKSQLRTFLFAGHETTATTIAGALHLVGTRPDVESRLHGELDAVLDGADPSLSDLDALQTTDNVVRETLRLYPPAFRLPRVAATDVELGGYRIEAGTDVLVYTVTPHRDDRFWDAPMAFRPSRWDSIEPESTGFEYVPFGAGPRRCIGERFALLETRLVLATLGSNYAFEPTSDFEVSALVSATPNGSLPATVNRR